jgi:hypothetical protein
MTETVALIAALAAVAGLGGVLIVLMRRCAQLDRDCRLLLRTCADLAPRTEPRPQLHVIQGGRR